MRMSALIRAGIIACAFAGLGWATNASAADAYPAGPVTLVVAYPPGGTGDIIARVISNKLASALGQPVKLDYRAGASGAVGTRSVVQAQPNGQTLLVGQTGEIAIVPSVTKGLDYNPANDLQPVALLAVVPLALVVSSAAPYSSVEELLKASRASPRGLLYASAGRSTPGYFAGELLRLRSQGKFAHMGFEGGGPALEALLAGRVDFYFPAFPTAFEEKQGGRLKILAISSVRRSLAAPAVPTLMEAGVRDFDLNLWAGIFAPRSTPKEIVTRLNQEINQVIADARVRDRLLDAGADLMLLSPDQFRQFVAAETNRYAKLIDDEFCATCPC